LTATDIGSGHIAVLILFQRLDLSPVAPTTISPWRSRTNWPAAARYVAFEELAAGSVSPPVWIICRSQRARR
jgi:hypothetical protein